jgi:hypothetical protein
VWRNHKMKKARPIPSKSIRRSSWSMNNDSCGTLSLHWVANASWSRVWNTTWYWNLGPTDRSIRRKKRPP